MIERHWKGVAKPEAAETYIHHLQSKTFPNLAKIPGFVKASILRRPVEGGVEFLIVTTWQSIGAIKAFAGEKVEEANVPLEAREMMISFDPYARHFEVLQ